jgi:tRNA(fMet)-specific endonuclease VapC
VARLGDHQAEVAIAAIVWHELWFGLYRLPVSAKRSAIETYLNEVVAVTMPVLAYDERAAEWHARERARLASAGRTPAFADAQIAAIAVTHDLALVTLDAADYKDFEGLTVQEWTG